MDRTKLIALAATTLLVAAFACPAPAQDAGGDAPEHPAMDPEVMAKMMAMAQPGPEHETLEKMVGEWELESHVYMSPGAEPMVMSGTGSAKMILGGRFLQAHIEGGEGMFAMEGINILGYDRRKDEYTLVGFDTMGTYWVSAAGGWDDDCECISMYGEDDDPLVGVVKKYWFNYYPVSDDEFRWEIVFDGEALGYDAPHRMVEVINRRVE